MCDLKVHRGGVGSVPQVNTQFIALSLVYDFVNLFGYEVMLMAIEMNYTAILEHGKRCLT